jgi:lipopolysaccharide transport system ATP-binding protein
MRPIVTIRGLSKEYRIAPSERRAAHYDTLRELLVRTARAPIEHFRSAGLPKGKIWALSDVSFDVMPGEVVGLIGPNGAGKSTLLKILSRIIEPTRGRVELFGRVASLLEIGTGFHPDLTGRENVYLNGAVLGMKRREIDGRFDEIVAFAEVEKFLDTAVKHYSSGMYLRLAFAVAAHLNPEILIVDEVLAVGDANFQRKCLAKMDEVTRSGRTVLVVSHAMTMITRLCERAVLLMGGRVETIGAAADVVNRYNILSATNGDLDPSISSWRPAH